MNRSLQTILSDTAAEKSDALQTLEGEFRTYFQDHDQVTAIYNPVTPANATLIDRLNNLIMCDESDAKTGQPHLEALTYLIVQYGSVLHGEKVVLKQKAKTFLESAAMKPYVEANNRQLISMINRQIGEREAIFLAKNRDKTARGLLKKNIWQDLPKEDPTKQLKLNHSVAALSHFLYYLENPTEEEAMNRELTTFLQEFAEPLRLKGWSEYDLLRKIYVNCIHEKIEDRWPILDTLYVHYTKMGRSDFKNFLKSLEQANTKQGRKNTQAINKFISDLKATQEAYDDASYKISTYKRYIFWAGFAFGMEIAMLALENLALMSSLGPLGVLGLIAASCVVFGILIGKFFKSGHAAELEKQLRFEYFHHKSNIAIDTQSKGAFIAKWGTIIEGAAASVLLLTLGAFTLDMVAWAIVGGSYTSALPGLFFATLSSSAFFIIPAVITACILVGFTIRAGLFLQKTHYSLDGKEAEAYYKHKEKEERQRTSLPVENQTEPLIFSAKPWSQKIGDSARDLLSPLNHSPTRPIFST